MPEKGKEGKRIQSYQCINQRVGQCVRQQSTDCWLTCWPYNIQDASLVCQWCIGDFV